MALAVALNNAAFFTDLPALPPVSQAAVATRVVTHPSYHGEPAQNFEFTETGGNDYRRDALLGDALLKGFLTELIHERFPLLVPGAATIILSAVWSNASLARLAEGYGLQHDLRAAPAQRAALRGNQGVRASLFEARLYGIHLSSGDTSYETIKTFIASLFIPILAAQRAAFQNVSQPSASNAQSFEDYVSRLNTICQRRGAGRIEYILVDQWGPAHAPSFTVVVYINGISKGTGSGETVKEARQEAAMLAIADLTVN